MYIFYKKFVTRFIYYRVVFLILEEREKRHFPTSETSSLLVLCSRLLVVNFKFFDRQVYVFISQKMLLKNQVIKFQLPVVGFLQLSVLVKPVAGKIYSNYYNADR